MFRWGLRFQRVRVHLVGAEAWRQEQRGACFLIMRQREGEHWGVASKPTPGTYLQQAQTSESFPKASNSCGPIIQTQEPVEASLIQTTTPGSFTGWAGPTSELNSEPQLGFSPCYVNHVAAEDLKPLV